MMRKLKPLQICLATIIVFLLFPAPAPGPGPTPAPASAHAPGAGPTAAPASISAHAPSSAYAFASESALEAHEPNPEIRIIIDGDTAFFEPQPRILNGRIMVPMRPLFEQLGADIEWDEEEQAVTSWLGGRKAKVFLGVWKALVDGNLVELEAPPVLINGRIFVPLRFISEALGCTVDWDEKSRTAFIFKPPLPPLVELRPQLTAAKVAELGITSAVTIRGETKQGSGFYLGEGLVATSFHLLEGQFRLSLLTDDDVSHDMVEVLAFDRERDLAILEAPEVELPSLPLGDSERVKVGQSVVAVGSPLGLKSTVSDGVISAVNRQLPDNRYYIQFTAPVSPGSSGGPLLNMYGEVIGITTAYARNDVQNINFAIPVNKLKPLLIKAMERKNDIPGDNAADNAL